MHHTLDTLDGTLWLAEPARLRLAIALASSRPCPSARELAKIRRKRLDVARQCAARAVRGVKGRVGVIPIHGPVEQRLSAAGEKAGAVSTEEIGMAFDALLADKSVQAVVLHIDSPGGTSYGTEELADKIYAARGQKPCYALSDSDVLFAAFGSARPRSTSPARPAGTWGAWASTRCTSTRRRPWKPRAWK
jgi:hypothetical protein